MPAAHCAICLNHFPIDADKPEFLIFPCGHGFCVRCTDQLFSQRRTTCPTCRKDIRKADGHPVYLELVDKNTVYAKTVIDGLDQMGPNTPLGSVQKASLKLQNAITTAPQDSGTTLSAIMKALEEFNNRIIPCFEMAEKYKQEIKTLQENLQQSNQDKQCLESRLTEAEGWKKENARLRSTVTRIRSERETALQLAEQAKDETEKARRSAESCKTKLDETEAENNNFRTTIARHIEQARTRRAKYEEVVKERNALRERQRATENQDRPNSMRHSESSAHEYEADFSSHESSGIHNIQQIIMSSPSRLSQRAYPDGNDMQLEFQGMPPPTFGSDWQLSGSISRPTKKRAVSGMAVANHRRVASSFPIMLDPKGHPIRPVQLGPRTTLHVGR